LRGILGEKIPRVKRNHTLVGSLRINGENPRNMGRNLETLAPMYSSSCRVFRERV